MHTMSLSLFCEYYTKHFAVVAKFKGPKGLSQVREEIVIQSHTCQDIPIRNCSARFNCCCTLKMFVPRIKWALCRLCLFKVKLTYVPFHWKMIKGNVHNCKSFLFNLAVDSHCSMMQNYLLHLWYTRLKQNVKLHPPHPTPTPTPQPPPTMISLKCHEMYFLLRSAYCRIQLSFAI